MDNSRSQEYCEVRIKSYRKDMDNTISIHQAAVKASARLESTITEGHLSQPSYSTVLHSINERMAQFSLFGKTKSPTELPNGK